MSERLKNFLAYAAIVFNVLIGAASIYSVAKEITSSIWVIIAIGVAFLAICAGAAWVIERAYKPLTDKNISLSDGYSKFADVYKNESCRLKDCFQCEDNPDRFKIEILRGCRDLIKEAQSTLASTLGKKVRVCIKMFKDKSKDYVFTYCRDELTVDQSIKKEHNQNIDVNHNTNFSDIMNHNKEYFLGSTLQKDYKEKKYHNTNKEFKYESAIVFPIRTLVKAVNDDDKDESYYDTIGFLCVDSKQKHMFDNGQAKLCVNYIGSIAELLYVFISQGNEYYDSIKANLKEEVNNG